VVLSWTLIALVFVGVDGVGDCNNGDCNGVNGA